MSTSIRPLRRMTKHPIQDQQHMAIITNQPLARRIAPVARARGHLVPHGREVHVQARVVLDHVLEFLDDRDQGLLRVRVDVLDVAAEPFAVDAVVCWEPVADSFCCLLVSCVGGR
jgi:hypothetical protein